MANNTRTTILDLSQVRLPVTFNQKVISSSPWIRSFQDNNKTTANSTVTSSGNSTTSSSDNLPELHIASSVSTRPQPTTFVERDIFQRLHTSTTRKVGESPLAESPPQILSPKITATVVTQETKAKKPRWSMMNKKNALAAA